MLLGCVTSHRGGGGRDAESCNHLLQRFLWTLGVLISCLLSPDCGWDSQHPSCPAPDSIAQSAANFPKRESAAKILRRREDILLQSGKRIFVGVLKSFRNAWWRGKKEEEGDITTDIEGAILKWCLQNFQTSYTHQVMNHHLSLHFPTSHSLAMRQCKVSWSAHWKFRFGNYYALHLIYWENSA